METADEVLEHFGIRGMRWGQRKIKGTSGSHKGKPRANGVSADAQKAHEGHRTIQEHRSTDPLSNDQLQHVVNRINLEQQYARLTTPQKNKGQKLAEDILIGTGKQVAGEVAKQHTTAILVKKGIMTKK